MFLVSLSEQALKYKKKDLAAFRFALERWPDCPGITGRIGAETAVSYVAVRIGGLGPTRLGRLLHVSTPSVLRGVQIGEQLIIKNRWELNSFWS